FGGVPLPGFRERYFRRKLVLAAGGPERPSREYSLHEKPNERDPPNHQWWMTAEQHDFRAESGSTTSRGTDEIPHACPCRARLRQCGMCIGSAVRVHQDRDERRAARSG